MSSESEVKLEGELDITLFIACYNEEKNIESTLDTVLAAVDEVGCSYEIIVIDDASRDRSVDLINSYQRARAHRPIRLIVNEYNKGLGQNYIEGAFQGRGRYYRLVCGDDVESRETLVQVLRHLGAADVVIPYHERCEGKSLPRRALSRTYTLVVNAITGYRIRYYNGMALHLRYNVMRWHTDYQGFGFQADLIARVLNQGASHLEIPVVVRERDEGQSSALTLLNLFSVAHMLLDLVIRRIGQVGYGRRLGPAGAADDLAIQPVEEARAEKG